MAFENAYNLADDYYHQNYSDSQLITHNMSTGYFGISMAR